MPRSSNLVGRDALVRQVADSLRAGRSVLLFGPESVGKSAIIAAVASPDLVIVDPFEHITVQRACRMRRALDQGVVHLGAARVTRGRELGAVGRIMWRFLMVRVRELPDPVVHRIVVRELRERGEGRLETAWAHEITTLARGRPGFATTMTRFAVEWKQEHGYLPMPALAFAATRADATIRTLRAGERSGVRSAAASKVHP